MLVLHPEMNNLELHRDLPKNPTILVVGTRYSGKTTLIKDLLWGTPMYAKQFSTVVVAQQIPTGEYPKNTGRFAGLDYDDLIGAVVEAAGADETFCLVIDSFLSPRNRSSALQELFCNGKHLGVAVIATAQTMKSVPPSYRHNLHAIIVTRLNNATEQRIVFDEGFAPSGQTPSDFDSLLGEFATERKSVMLLPGRAPVRVWWSVHEGRPVTGEQTEQVPQKVDCISAILNGLVADGRLRLSLGSSQSAGCQSIVLPSCTSQLVDGKRCYVFDLSD